jgi:hypothetical protein
MKNVSRKETFKAERAGFVSHGEIRACGLYHPLMGTRAPRKNVSVKETF